MSECARLRALRADLLREFPARPAIYWIDLAASATIAWIAGLVAVLSPNLLATPAIVIAALATLRAAYFVHEIAHLRRALPGFELAWNVFVGAWVQIPSTMADAHVDHHRLSTYGTANDPEYARIATWRRWQLVASVATMPLVPALLVVRFGVIGPLSWLVPPARRFVWRYLSTLQLDAGYYRTIGNPYSARGVAFELLATCAIVVAVVGVANGLLPLRAAWIWWCTTSLALAINQARTLLAHAYEGTGEPMTLSAQVADSITATRGDPLGAVSYVLGTRYHALHHLAPQLPYHQLAAAHAWLMSRDPPSSYVRACVPGLARGLAARWQR